MIHVVVFITEHMCIVHAGKMRKVRYGEVMYVPMCTYVYLRSDQQSSMPEELFFFLASLTCILDLPDLPWAFIHDYLSFLTSTSTFLSYHFYSFYISSHCCLSIHHSYHLAARYLCTSTLSQYTATASIRRVFH